MDARSLTIIDVARYALRYWYVALTCFVLFLAPFVLYALYATPVYRATAVMAPASVNGAGGGLAGALGQLSGLAGLADAAGIVGGQSPEVEEALAILHSRPFTSAMLADLDAEGAIARQLGLTTGGKLDDRARAKVARYFDRAIRSVSLDKKTGLYRVFVDWTDPAAAAVWANETVARLNAAMRTRAAERSRANQRYLQEEAARASQVDARNALSRLLEAEIRQLMLANVTPEYAFRVVDPATTPEPDEKIRPNRRSLVITGTMLAFLASLAVVVVIGSLKTRPAA